MNEPKPSFDLSPELTYLRDQGLVGNPEPSAALAFQKTFEQMGGTQRMLLWADKYPASFYKLYARQIIPTISPVLPQPAKASEQEWPAWLTARRLSYQEAGFKPTAGGPPDAMDDPDIE
jgi:hypothetical protein